MPDMLKEVWAEELTKLVEAENALTQQATTQLVRTLQQGMGGSSAQPDMPSSSRPMDQLFRIADQLGRDEGGSYFK